MTPSAFARLRLVRTDGVGPLTYRRLLARCPDPEEALRLLPDLARQAGRPALTLAPEASVVAEAEHLRRAGARLIFLGDSLYPRLLAMLADAPPALSVLGSVDLLATRAVALVGARNASGNALRMAEALAADLADRRLTVVSGLARGIDAAAHEGALRLGFTIAAIAGGLDQPYPPEHAELQARIAERGAVVSEAPWGTAPQSRHFPRRNRIIAGLALGTIVIEAALRSGTLITARIAQDADREIFAVPGSPLDPRCHGSNDLIRQGAHLVESAADVLAHLPDYPTETTLFPAAGFSAPTTSPPAPPTRDARARVLAVLGPAPTLIDDLLRHATLPAEDTLAALAQLELAGLVEVVGNRAARCADIPDLPAAPRRPSPHRAAWGLGAPPKAAGERAAKPARR